MCVCGGGGGQDMRALMRAYLLCTLNKRPVRNCFTVIILGYSVKISPNSLHRHLKTELVTNPNDIALRF